MSLQNILKNSFDNELIDKFKDKTEVKNFLINHERKDLCIQNLVKEIKKEELRGNTLSHEQVKVLGKEYAKTFAHAALKLAEEQSVSELERQRRIKESEEKEIVANMFSSEDNSQSLG